MRVCKTCNKNLELDCFNRKSGRSCIPCHNKRRSELRRINSDQINYRQKIRRNNLSQEEKDRVKSQVKKYKKKYYWENVEKLKLEVREYRKANRGKCNYWQALRDNRKNKATPNWLTEEDKKVMKSLYENAAMLSETMGVDYHVDHIYPLKHDYCCGLHVPWNLRVITAQENLVKGNKILPNFFESR